MSFEKLMNYIDEENLIKRFLIFLLGVLILALNYNLFIVPNNFILGGASGLSVILNNIFHISPVIFVYIINFILIITSAFLLGKVDTRRAIIGAILFPFLIVCG